jgi:hypothetical protein
VHQCVRCVAGVCISVSAVSLVCASVCPLCRWCVHQCVHLTHNGYTLQDGSASSRNTLSWRSDFAEMAALSLRAWTQAEERVCLLRGPTNPQRLRQFLGCISYEIGCIISRGRDEWAGLMSTAWAINIVLTWARTLQQIFNIMSW